MRSGGSKVVAAPSFTQHTENSQRIESCDRRDLPDHSQATLGDPVPYVQPSLSLHKMLDTGNVCPEQLERHHCERHYWMDAWMDKWMLRLMGVRRGTAGEGCERCTCADLGQSGCWHRLPPPCEMQKAVAPSADLIQFGCCKHIVAPGNHSIQTHHTVRHHPESLQFLHQTAHANNHKVAGPGGDVTFPVVSHGQDPKKGFSRNACIRPRT